MKIKEKFVNTTGMTREQVRQVKKSFAKRGWELFQVVGWTLFFSKVKP